MRSGLAAGDVGQHASSRSLMKSKLARPAGKHHVKQGLYSLYPQKDTKNIHSLISKGTLYTLTRNSNINPASCEAPRLRRRSTQHSLVAIGMFPLFLTGQKMGGTTIPLRTVSIRGNIQSGPWHSPWVSWSASFSSPTHKGLRPKPEALCSNPKP